MCTSAQALCGRACSVGTAAKSEIVEAVHRLKLREEDAASEDGQDREQRLVHGHSVADRAVGERLVQERELHECTHT